MAATTTTEPSSDARLLAAAQDGDAAACTQLVDRHLAAVHRFAWRQLDDASEAEDVAQEVFLRLWQRSAPWREQGAQLRTWLLTLTRNLCVDRLRQRRPGAAPDEALIDADADTHGRLERAQVAHDLQTAIRALPERQRVALQLVHEEGMGNADAAAVLGVSVEALESLLARARRTLRAQLAAHA